jgi:hypothetical protein
VMPPTGWAPIANRTWSTTGWRLFTKTAGGSEPSTYVFSSGKAATGALSIWAWRSSTLTTLVVTDVKTGGSTGTGIVYTQCLAATGSSGHALFAATSDSATVNSVLFYTERIDSASATVSRYLATRVYSSSGYTLAAEAGFTSGSHASAWGSMLVEEMPSTALCRLGDYDLPLPSVIEVGHAPVALRNPTVSGHQAFMMLSPAFKETALTSIKSKWEALYEEELINVRSGWIASLSQYVHFYMTGLELPINDTFTDHCMVAAMPDKEFDNKFTQGYRGDDPSPDALLYDVEITFVSEPMEQV